MPATSNLNEDLDNVISWQCTRANHTMESKTHCRPPVSLSHLENVIKLKKNVLKYAHKIKFVYMFEKYNTLVTYLLPRVQGFVKLNQTTCHVGSYGTKRIVECHVHSYYVLNQIKEIMINKIILC